MLFSYYGKGHIYKQTQAREGFEYVSNCKEGCQSSKIRVPLSGWRRTIKTCGIKTEKLIKDNHSQCTTETCYDKRIHSGKQEVDYKQRIANRSYGEYLRKKGKTYNQHLSQDEPFNSAHKLPFYRIKTDNCSLDCDVLTVHKFSNVKYMKQGAVSSSSRIERLKMESILQSRASKENKTCCVKVEYQDGTDDFIRELSTRNYHGDRELFTGFIGKSHKGYSTTQCVCSN
jgi:hypothetical protein